MEGIRKGSPVVPVLHLTDVHMGAVQDSNEIEGFNAYSPEIADNRAVDLTVRWLNWVNYQRKAYRIDEGCYHCDR